MLTSAFGILCGFALVIFAAACPPGLPALAITAAAALGTWLVIPSGSLPDPVWSALVVLTISGLLLWRPDRGLPAALGAGAAGAAWTALLAGQGIPSLLALLIAAGLAATVFAMRRRSEHFAPPNLVEEALLICAAFAVVIGCWPAVSSGYRSAMVFTAERVSAPAAADAPWALQLSVGLLVLGGLYGLWMRR